MNLLEISLSNFPKRSCDTFDRLKSIVDKKRKSLALALYENERLDSELRVIERTDTASVFLFFYDTAQAVRGVVLHGLCHCSYLLYFLGLTKINPFDYRLPFERYYNENRKFLPIASIVVQKGEKGALVKYLKNQYGADNITNISDCIIDVTSDVLFQINSNNGYITVENSKINNISNGTVFAINSPADVSEVFLKNVDLSSEYNKLSNYTTYMKLNVSNLTHNNNKIPVLISDIDANTRRSLALNTIIMAPIETGLFYRKTSDGNLTTNWTLYGAA